MEQDDAHAHVPRQLRRHRTVDLGDLALRRIVLALLAFLLIATFNPLGVKRNSEMATQDFFETIFASVLPRAALTTPEDAYRHILNHGPLPNWAESEAAAARFMQQLAVTDWSDEQALRANDPHKAKPWAPIHILRFDDTVMAKIDPPKVGEYRRFGRHQLPLDKVTVMLRLLSRLKVSVVFLDIRFLADTVPDGRFCDSEVHEWARYTQHPGNADQAGTIDGALSGKPFLFLAGLSAGHALRAQVAEAMDAGSLDSAQENPLQADAVTAGQGSGADRRTRNDRFWLPRRFECLREIGQLVPVQWVGTDYPIAIDAAESVHQPRTIRQLGTFARGGDPAGAQTVPLTGPANALMPSPAAELFAAWCLHPASLVREFPQCNPRFLKVAYPDIVDSARRTAIRAALGVRPPGSADASEPWRLAVRPYARTPKVYLSLPDSTDPEITEANGEPLKGMVAVHGCRPEDAFLDDHDIFSWPAALLHGKYVIRRLGDELIGNRAGTDGAYARGCSNIAMHEAFFSPAHWPQAGNWRWASFVKQSFVGSAVIVAGNFDNAPDTVSSSLFGNKVGAFLHAEALQCLVWYGDHCPRRAQGIIWELDRMDLVELGILLLLMAMSRGIIRKAHLSQPSPTHRPRARRFLCLRVHREYALGYQRALVACIPVALLATILGMVFLPYPSADLLALVLVLGVIFREGAVGLVQRFLWRISEQVSLRLLGRS
ncbi:MAG: hypothetical protein P1U65_05475 [Minwuia sp.]|nr:hypothetical protein [Minwuia sp.]